MDDALSRHQREPRPARRDGPTGGQSQELDVGYTIQFHRGNGRVISLTIDADVGRQLSQFLDDCLAQRD